MQYHYVRCVPRIPHVSSQIYSASHPWKQHMWRDWNIFPHGHHTLDLPRTHYQSPVPTSKGDLRWRPSDLRWHAKSWILFNWIKRLQDISDFEAYIPYINPCLLRINASRKISLDGTQRTISKGGSFERMASCRHLKIRCTAEKGVPNDHQIGMYGTPQVTFKNIWTLRQINMRDHKPKKS